MFLQRHLLQLAVSSCHKPQAEAHFNAIVFYVPQDHYQRRNLWWACGANTPLPNIFSTQEFFLATVLKRGI